MKAHQLRRLRLALEAHPKAWARRLVRAKTEAELVALAGRRRIDGERVWDGHAAGERLGELLDEATADGATGRARILEDCLRLAGILERGKVPILELAFVELELEALTARERDALGDRDS